MSQISGTQHPFYIPTITTIQGIQKECKSVFWVVLEKKKVAFYSRIPIYYGEHIPPPPREIMPEN